MVRQDNWYNARLVRRIRITLTVILWVIVIFLLYLNHSWILKLLTTIF